MLDGAKKNQANADGIGSIQSLDAAQRNKGISADQIQQIDAALRGGIVSSSAAAAGPDPLLTDLISYWKLDASGVTVDSHGSNTLTDNNTVGSAAGKIQEGVSLVAASSEYLSRVSNASLELGNIDFTIQAWFKATTFPATSPVVVAKSSPAGWDYYLYHNGSGFSFDVGTGAGRAGQVADSSTFNTGTWYHILCWHDAAADTVNIQTNNGTIFSATTSGVAPAVNNFLFHIGAADSGTAEFWNGVIDEVAFWKRTLTEAERARLYNSGNGLAYPFN
jgi:hypothetical protein